MLDETIIKRLAFIRYMYTAGVEESKCPEPLSAVSILMFHDASELFLQVVCDIKNVNTHNTDFMTYFDILAKKANLTLAKRGMLELNRARGNLKHQGTIPSKFVIESASQNVTSFFLENTRLVFEMEFESISMSHFVHHEPARKNLEEAAKLIGESKLEESLEKTALAFRQLIDDYEVGKGSKSAFSVGKPLNFFWSSNMGIDNKKLMQFVDAVRDSLASMDEKLNILALGLNYKRYEKFDQLTPGVTKVMTEGPEYRILHCQRRKPLTRDDCQFCLDFVVESALRIQEWNT
jgi:hypothetical protein